MAPVSEDYRIDLVGGDGALAALCERALDGFAEVRAVSRAELLAHRRPPDLILLVLEGRSLPRIRLLAECRRWWPVTPVILLATHLDVAFAVEVVKCGAEDLLELPPHPEGFRGKVLRALLGRPGPAYGWAELEPLAPHAALEATGANLRRCYRATVPGYLQTMAVALVRGAERAELEVMDVSVEVGEAPGGMLLEVPRDAVSALPLEDWSSGTPASLLVQLADDPEPLAVVARMRGSVRPGGQQTRRLGMQFSVTAPADRARMQRFWMQCQRTVRPATKKK
jgi:DNA-binding response OmpR family regulator